MIELLSAFDLLTHGALQAAACNDPTLANYFKHCREVLIMVLQMTMECGKFDRRRLFNTSTSESILAPMLLLLTWACSATNIMCLHKPCAPLTDVAPLAIAIASLK